jgi:hypothetical protein
LKRSFDQSNYEIHKEKEMADFRKISVLLALVLLLGVSASAQTQLACTATTAVPPTLRSEGLTELAGDIILDCLGGVPTLTSTNVNQATFTVFTTVPLTNRVDSGTLPSPSDILLIVDEPGTTFNGSPLLVCPTPLSGCTFPGTSTTLNVPGPEPYNGTTVTSGTPAVTVSRPNVYRGVITGTNQVQFIGVPIDPPGTSSRRVFRFTNMRVNASAASGGFGTLQGSIQGLVSITSNPAITVNQNTQTIGLVSSGMNFDVRRRGDINASLNTNSDIAFAQCNSISNTATTASFIMQFTELFPSSFKARGGGAQSIPGTVYNTESGFTAAALGSFPNGTALGLADHGTRLKATFANVPTGVRVFVGLQNYVPSTAGTSQTSAAAAAALLSNELGSFFQVPATVTNGVLPAHLGAGTGTSAFEVPLVAGVGSAVWEVGGGAAQPQALISETFSIPVWFVHNAASTIPTGTATVQGMFAPSGAVLGSATAAAAVSTTLPIPRFTDAGKPTTPKSIFQIYLCRTNLMFPFVANTDGFDTGLAIANTGADPFVRATTTQTGDCQVYSYGDNQGAPFNTTSLAAGRHWSDLLSNKLPNFKGYLIAQCNFQYAHGFAFIFSQGLNAAHGYLALVMPDVGTGGTRAAGTESLGQ